MSDLKLWPWLASLPFGKKSDTEKSESVSIGTVLKPDKQTATSPYVYAPLSGESQIRLLKVTGSVTEPEIWYYELLTTALDEAPPYETVSYVWGNPARPHHLKFADGSFLGLTESMREALPTLSLFCETGYLWIDQICINQKDKGERGQQVKLMGDLYRSCERVLIFLGSLNLGWDDLQILHMLFDLRSDEDMRRVFTTDDTIAIAKFASRNNKEESIMKDVRQCFGKLLSHAWFTRAWVVQEAVLPREAFFVLDGRATTFNQVESLTSAIYEPGSKTFGLQQTTEMIRLAQLVDLRFQRLKDRRFGPNIDFDLSRPTFWDTLSDLAPISQSTDPRDRVYAFLGIQQDGHVHIEPDYSSSPSSVFQKAAISFIQGRKSLDLLGYANGRVLSEDRPFGNLPTWTPDWRARQAVWPISRTKWSLFSAAAERLHLADQDGEGTHRLHVRGKFVDEVVGIYGGFEDINWIGIDSLGLLGRMIEMDLPSDTLQDRYSSIARLLKVIIAGGIPQFHSRNKEMLSNEQIDGLAISYLDHCLGVEGDPSRHATKFREIKERNAMTIQRRIAITRRGRLALVDKNVHKRDAVSILHGSKTPIILRKAADGYQLKGQAYVEDIMFGEAVTWAEEEADELILI